VVNKQQREQALLTWINQATDFHCSELNMVSGDASFRRYFRFDAKEASLHKTIIAVDAPPDFEDSHKFVAVANAYLKCNVPVPNVLAHNCEEGFYLLEDFGDVQFANQLNDTNMQNWYSKAIAILPNIQRCESSENGTLPEYDDHLLNNELYLFTHWLMKVHLKLNASETELAMIRETYNYLVDVFRSQPQVGVHRDYHSRNLMVIGQNQIGVIDFQDAVVGPITYDLVSLLRDCYQYWNHNQVDTLLKLAHQQHYSQYDWQ